MQWLSPRDFGSYELLLLLATATVSLTDCCDRLIRVQHCTCQTSYHHRLWVPQTSLSSQVLYHSRSGFLDLATWGLALSVLCCNLAMMSPSGIERLQRSFTRSLLFNGLYRRTWVSQYLNNKPFWILLKQKWWGVSRITWTICKSFITFLKVGWSCGVSRGPINSIKALKALSEVIISTIS